MTRFHPSSAKNLVILAPGENLLQFSAAAGSPRSQQLPRLQLAVLCVPSTLALEYGIFRHATGYGFTFGPDFTSIRGQGHVWITASGGTGDSLHGTRRGGIAASAAARGAVFLTPGLAAMVEHKGC